MDGCIIAGSESKKRGCEEFEELSEPGQKRTKIRDLESVFRSEGEMKINTTPTLDLNSKSCDDTPSSIEDTIKPLPTNCIKSRGFGLDLNSEDSSSSVSHNFFHPYKNNNHTKPIDSSSECGSSCNLGLRKDSMRVWKEMKQNGFLSSSHGGVPVPPMPPMPKPRGRKKANESVIRKKIEIAKKEQVDRFAKVAAPSGLLNELNPGIINHVRNRKQVHSIIENLVRSAKTENSHGGSKQIAGKECYDRKDLETSSFGCESDDLVMKDRELVVKNSDYDSCSKLEHEDDKLALKLSSSAAMDSVNMSALSNEESGNVSTVNSLSVKAASVASQWLELLHQDIKGRLAALRRSKKRVRAVIQTEMPFLVSHELISNQEHDHCAADLHRARWSALFDQMDNALSDEEKHLESSLNQVHEMLLHCEHGLLQFHPPSDYILPKAETSLDKDLAVRAAAAAIYSTSNFLQSMENLPCF